MKTLYDLLEALPDDDADGIRAAFRRAAKANHPDFNPGNAEASERFRRIVRANAILSDGRQRAEYDRLLQIAKQQQNPPEEPMRGRLACAVRRLAAGSIASAAVFVVLIGGYFASRSADRLPLASAQVVEFAQHQSAEPSPAEAVVLAEIPEKTEARITAEIVEDGTITPSHGMPPAADETAIADKNAAPAATVVIAAASGIPDAGYQTRDVTFYRERGMRAYRSGDLYLALANFDLAIDLDPSLPESYLDRGIVFHRLGDLKRAFSDVAEAKRIEAANRTTSTSAAGAH